MTSAVQDGHGALADGVALTPDTAEQLGALYARIVESVQSVLYADDNTVQLAVGCLLAQGHLLVEDLPGLGKTTLAKALARSLGLDFHRVQFTADLLPADVTGAMVLDRDRGEPTFRPGPIFTNVLMADELNRASARSQSALLEAMEERQVTADGTTMPLPRPFMVLATQNPFDAAGTSPLPAGQRDRFLLRLSMGYPSRAHEDRLLSPRRRHHRSTSSVPRSVGATSMLCCAASATSMWPRQYGATSSTSLTPAAPTPLWPSAHLPGVPLRSDMLRAPWRWLRAGTTSYPLTCSGRPSRRSATGSSSSRAASAPGPASAKWWPTSSIRSRSQAPRPRPTPESGADTVARETTIRGRSALPGHEVRRGVGITRLRPTWRGVAVAVVAVALAVVAIAADDSTLLLILVVVAFPLVIAPFVVLQHAHRAAGAQIHMMIAPPLVPVGAPCELLVQLTHSGGSNLPAVSLERPSDRSRLAVPGAQPSTGLTSLPVTLAPEIGRLIRWDQLRPDESASSTLTLPTRRRGVFTIGPLRLWVHDPFALIGLTVAVARPVTLVVHPSATVGLASPAVRPGTSGSTQFSDGPAAIHTDDPGGEWSGLRPYRARRPPAPSLLAGRSSFRGASRS